jgi:signal transduction histidine kinase
VAGALVLALLLPALVGLGAAWRVGRRQRDEIGRLERAMGEMGEGFARARARLDEETEAHLGALEQLRHADRLATVGKLVASIAHELGTPLSTVSNRGQLIASGALTGTDARESGRIIVEQSGRMAQIIRQTLDYARRDGPQRQRVDLARLVRQSFSLVRPLSTRNRVKLELKVGDTDPVLDVDPGRLLQVLVNLVTNGLQAMASGGTLTVQLSRRHVTPPVGEGVEGEHACIEVRDQGRGIPAADRPQIFDAFFTTKRPGEGTGLGLAIAQGIVHEHGGWIDLDSEEGVGSTFRIFLPLEEKDRCLAAS